jgi:hypothetical protein
MKKIQELKYHDNLRGLDVVQIIVGDFSTGIAKWKENGFFQMSINTTPKCFVIGPTDRDFKTVEEAKKYYLEGLKICMEDTLYLLEDVEYRTYIKKGEIK